jgi:hypothetical protein
MESIQNEACLREPQTMHQITVEPALGKALGELEGQAVLCDSSGRALGFFSPLGDRLQVDDLQLEPPLTIAETEELRKVRSGKPLDEILGRLDIP